MNNLMDKMINVNEKEKRKLKKLIKKEMKSKKKLKKKMEKEKELKSWLMELNQLSGMWKGDSGGRGRHNMPLTAPTASGIGFWSSLRDAVNCHPRKASMVSDLSIVGCKIENGKLNSIGNNINNNIISNMDSLDVMQYWFLHYVELLKKSMKIFFKLDEKERMNYCSLFNVKFENMYYKNYYLFIRDINELYGVWINGITGTPVDRVRSWAQFSAETASPFASQPLSVVWAARAHQTLQPLLSRHSVLLSWRPNILNGPALRTCKWTSQTRAQLASTMKMTEDEVSSLLEEKKKNRNDNNNNKSRKYYNRMNYNRSFTSGQKRKGPASRNGVCKYGKACTFLAKGECHWTRHE